MARFIQQQLIEIKAPVLEVCRGPGEHQQPRSVYRTVHLTQALCHIFLQPTDPGTAGQRAAYALS